MSAVVSAILAALLRIVMQIGTVDLAERVLRRVLPLLLEYAVKSTQNSVDDEMAAPIVAALRESKN